MPCFFIVNVKDAARLRDLTDFACQWDRNLKAQGFCKE